jgi:hypothetical protein
MSVGCSLGCAECDGGTINNKSVGTNPNGIDRCSSGKKPWTNNDPLKRTFNRNCTGACIGSEHDFTKYNPCVPETASLLLARSLALSFSLALSLSRALSRSLALSLLLSHSLSCTRAPDEHIVRWTQVARAWRCADLRPLRPRRRRPAPDRWQGRV